MSITSTPTAGVRRKKTLEDDGTRLPAWKANEPEYITAGQVPVAMMTQLEKKQGGRSKSDATNSAALRCNRNYKVRVVKHPGPRQSRA